MNSVILFECTKGVRRRGLLYPSSHSRRASLDTLASTASCSRWYRFAKTIINRFFVIFPVAFAYSYIVSQSFLFFKRFVAFLSKFCRKYLFKGANSKKILTIPQVCVIISFGYAKMAFLKLHSILLRRF